MQTLKRYDRQLCILYIESTESFLGMIKLVSALLDLTLTSNGEHEGDRYSISLFENDTWDRSKALSGEFPYSRFIMEMDTNDPSVALPAFVHAVREFALKLSFHCDRVELYET